MGAKDLYLSQRQQWQSGIRVKSIWISYYRDVSRAIYFKLYFMENTMRM